MGLSNRKFAALAGVTESAVRKAKLERIAGAVLADGTIDADLALKLWGKNTDPSKQRKDPPPASSTSKVDATAAPDAGNLKPASGPDVSIARAALVIEKAKREQIKRKKDEGSVIERRPSLAKVQTLARDIRNSFMGFPDKYHAQIASEIEVDPVTGKVDVYSVYAALAKYQRKHLEDQVAKIQDDIL